MKSCYDCTYVPKQMVTKSLYDYTIRELAELYEEMHPDEKEDNND